MVSSKCKDYVEVNKEDDNDGNTHIVDADEEGGSSARGRETSNADVSSSAASLSKRFSAAFVICSFAFGFVLGAVALATAGPTLFGVWSVDARWHYDSGDGNGSHGQQADESAVSYNFLRTTKGSETLRVLLNELFEAPNPSSGEELSSSVSGPRRALTHLSELMENDSQIHSSCHPIAHNLGRAAYLYFGGLDAAYDGMVGTDDARLLRLCNAAYLHGVIEFQLRDVGDVNYLVSAASQIEEKVCKNMNNVPAGAWECRHGIGHGIIQRYRMDAEKSPIQKGVEACKQTASPVDCENGLWMDHFAVSGNIQSMENRMMASDVLMETLTSFVDGSLQGNNDSSNIQERFRLPPLSPTLQICNLGTDDFDCFIYAVTEYLLVHPGDYVGALKYCTNPSANITKSQINLCTQGVGTQCAKENMNDFSVVERVCETLELEAGISCFRTAVSYYDTSSGGKRPRDAGVCKKVKRYHRYC